MRELHPYDHNWPVVYQVLRRHIDQNMRDVSIEHIGSTAVPGLKSKSMIDLLVVTRRQDLQEVKRALLTLGFHEREVWVDTPDKPYVCGSIDYEGKTHDINVHICPLNSATHVNALRFRDALRRDADLRQEYESIKTRAVQEVGTQPEAYNEFKARFIQRVIESPLTHTNDRPDSPTGRVRLATHP
jgi:GrpB-like predicted nucleotidyltransferase (UPF0157 family)